MAVLWALGPTSKCPRCRVVPHLSSFAYLCSHEYGYGSIHSTLQKRPCIPWVNNLLDAKLSCSPQWTACRVVFVQNLPPTESNTNQKTQTFCFRQSGLQTPGFVQLDSSRNSGLFCCIYVSRTPIWTWIIRKLILGHPFQKNNLKLSSDFAIKFHGGLIY